MLCSLVGVDMENYQGDLTDIVRGGSAGGGQVGSSSSSCTGSSSDHISINPSPSLNWDLQFPCHDPLNFTCTTIDDHRESTIFGDPFSLIMRDPLLLHPHELNNNNNMSASHHHHHASSAYYNTTPNSTTVTTTTTTTATASVEDHQSAGFCQQKSVFEDDMIKSPCNIFSRIQISSSSSRSPKLLAPISLCDSPAMPAAAASSSSPRGIKAPAMLTSDMINANSSKATTVTCLLDNNTAPVQISPPRNLGIKRRFNFNTIFSYNYYLRKARQRRWFAYQRRQLQTAGLVERGYYRCSSSKGCSARKQVERSRTDPNMLVITYTSEHNHPWPTQRNALAGSTRSQPSKNTTVGNAAASKNSPSSQSQNNNTKEEMIKENSNDTMSPVLHVGGASSSSASVKEEFDQENINEKQFDEMEEADHHHHLHHFSINNEGFSQIYKPVLPDDIHSNNQSEDFFADLGEIEADPLNLLFTQGFSAGTGDHEQKESKALEDPFNLFDWSAEDTHHNNKNNSFGEVAKRGL
ncbi:hypothetical protein JRO89_XS06G0006500 [Xanthoceras sorbifolium]|uniref:WRKY domain-containing protein n=1 Tax=Xanthoceras sorbifolium TaxID=99658 RepID=A0ABQ8HVU3_9ROSI|nr:hypothetical protein JRO89_XS06G0006500 [Xanthoceras sorbifolium]